MKSFHANSIPFSSNVNVTGNLLVLPATSMSGADAAPGKTTNLCSHPLDTMVG
jgi:hypothetical protein